MQTIATIRPLHTFIALTLSFTLIAVSHFILMAKWTDTKVHFVICDIGQGDAILIYHGFFQILIDSSRGDQVLGCLATYMPVWDHTIEVMVITHFDSDHTGGVAAIIKNYTVGQIFAPIGGSDGSRGAGQEAPQNATELPFGQPVKEPFLGQTVSTTSGIKLTFVPITTLLQVNASKFTTINSSTLEKNDTSLVTLIEYGEIKFLGVGDLEKTGESVLTALIEFGPIDILKVAHHGAKTSSTSQFLQATNPRMAVISAGRNNSYGHPAQETLHRLGQAGVQVLRTDELGTIDIVSDGSQWWQQ